MTRIITARLSACVLGIALASGASEAARAGDRLRGDTFVVDPGHGTRFPDGSPLNVGAVGPSGIEENKVTLAVGEDLAALLRAAGATVVLTRSFAKPYRTATDKRLDNRGRATLANTLHATAFIAVHADSSLARTAHGTSVFWLRPNSTSLANAVRARLAPLRLGEAAFHIRDLAVTNEARVPAVLVELGYVSNPAQERLLATPSFQKRQAQALFDAIADTFAR